MKKNTIIAAIAAASAILLCASCQKQELIEQNNGINATGKVFTATIGQGLTKTTITSDFKVNWLLNDEVSINEVKYTATPDASDPTKAALATTEAAPGKLDGKYKALYPYSLIVPAEGQNPAYFAFPATQTYAAGQFNAPMYAESETEVFTFNNICGVLCLSLKGTDKVKSISVTANEAICGKFTMTDAATVNLTGDGKTVTLDCGEGVQLNATTATNFYIYLPPKDSYTAGMKIVATSTEGKTFEKTTAKAVKIEKNNLYTFDWDATFSEPTPPTFKAVYNTKDGANTLTFYYDNLDYSREGTVYEGSGLFDSSKSGYQQWGYSTNVQQIKSVVIDPSVAGYKELLSTEYMFYAMTAATDISGAEYLDVSNVMNMSNMFNNFGRTSITKVPDVSGWETGQVTNMSSMFQNYGYSSATLNEVPDVSGWETGQVTNMSSMFQNYGNMSNDLNEVPDVSEWETGQVMNMKYMFNNYGGTSTALNKVPDVSRWDTGKVEDMGYMFQNYGKTSKILAEVPEVSDWNTEKVQLWSSIFNGYGTNSEALTTVPNVSKWKTNAVNKIEAMFQNFGSKSQNIVCSLDLSEWDLSNISEGANAFDFKPKTFNVTIPAKTGTRENDYLHWFYGNDNSHISPAGETGNHSFTCALTGVFSVSTTKKVHFSKGNLWYGPKATGASSTFNFETNQYDIPSSWTESHVSNFYWSQTASSAYAKSYDNVGTTDDVLFTNEDETTPKSDFTVNDNTGDWRTLSKEEWQYLLANHQYKYLSVNGKYGIAIAPDGFSGTIADSYTATTWDTAEAAGLVFLPNTGFRNNGTNIYEGDKSCFYWTSTAAPDDEDRNNRAYRMFFQWTGSTLSTEFENKGLREWAVGIRLVTDVPAK